MVTGLGLDFIIILSGYILNQSMSYKIIYVSDNFIRSVKSRIYGLRMNLHKHQFCLFEQHSELLTIW